MENVTSFSQTKNIEDWHSFTVLQISLMESLLEGRWIPVSAVPLRTVLMFSFSHMWWLARVIAKNPLGKDWGNYYRVPLLWYSRASFWGSSLFLCWLFSDLKTDSDLKTGQRIVIRFWSIALQLLVVHCLTSLDYTNWAVSSFAAHPCCSWRYHSVLSISLIFWGAGPLLPWH